MALFLDLVAVIGKTKNEVENSVANYIKILGGSFEQNDEIDPEDDDDCIIINESNNNTCILHNLGYDDSDTFAEFISMKLNATVFHFNIFDGNFWQYVLYNNGEIVDKFCPWTLFLEHNFSQEEIAEWKGDAKIITKYLPSIKISDIEKYLVRWDDDILESLDEKAFPTDEFEYGDCWQLVDFLNKLNLQYPIENDDKYLGKTYEFCPRALRKVPRQKEYPVDVKSWKEPCKSCGGVLGRRQYGDDDKPVTFLYLLGGYSSGVGAYYKCKSCGSKNYF